MQNSQTILIIRNTKFELMAICAQISDGFLSCCHPRHVGLAATCRAAADGSNSAGVAVSGIIRLVDQAALIGLIPLLLTLPLLATLVPSEEPPLFFDKSLQELERHGLGNIIN